jgi:hypothetical protein
MSSPQRMTPTKPKPEPKKSLAVKKREARKKQWQNLTNQIWLYLFCALGAVAHDILSIQNGAIAFTGADLATLAGSVLAAIMVMAYSESGGDIKGKRKNMKRRIREAILLGITSQLVLAKIVEKLFA